MIETVLKRKIIASAELLTLYDWRTWYFGDNVGFQGLMDASFLLKTEEYSDFCYSMATDWNSNFQGWKQYDQTLPSSQILTLSAQRKDSELGDRMQMFAGWLANAPVTSGLFLTDDDFRSKIWVDTMSFHPPFFARMGNVTGNEKYYSLALEFLMPNISVLMDSSGLFSHTYDVKTSESNNVHWARGQGWAILGMYDTAMQLPERMSEKKEIASILRRVLDKIIEFQREDGHWNTIIDDPDSGKETSLAAFYVSVADSAIHQQFIDEERHRDSIQRAWEGISGSWKENGVYEGVSGDTLSGDAAYYRSIPFQEVSPWAEGPAIMAAKAYLMGEHGKN